MNCNALVNIKLAENNQTYKVEDNLLYSKDGKTLYLVPNGWGEVLNIKQDVKIIYTLVTKSNKLIKEITIPNSVEIIQGYAFEGCQNLKTVTIESEFIAKSLSTQKASGELINNAQTLYIKEGITEIGSYVVDNFDKVETDKTGYVKYVKKTT